MFLNGLFLLLNFFDSINFDICYYSILFTLKYLSNDLSFLCYISSYHGLFWHLPELFRVRYFRFFVTLSEFSHQKVIEPFQNWVKKK